MPRPLSDRTDYDQLSELGFRQARLLEAFFNRIGTRFQAIYSGSLKRQVDTAEPLRSCFRPDVPQPELSILPEFNEYDSSAVIRTQLPHLIREDPSLEQDLPRLQTDRRALQRILDRSLSRWMSAPEEAEGLETWPAFNRRVQGRNRPHPVGKRPGEDRGPGDLGRAFVGYFKNGAVPVGPGDDSIVLAGSKRLRLHV